MSRVELPKNWLPKLEPWSPVISAIQYECYTWQVPKAPYGAGYIKFSGIYQHGSAGYDDARFIRQRLNEFAELTHIRGLVIDFRELVYLWGDDFRGEPDNFTGLPIRFLVSPPKKNADVYEAYKWALGEDKLRTNIHEAFNDIAQEFTVEERSKRQRGISINIKLEGDRYANRKELKRISLLQDQIVERGIGHLGIGGWLDFYFDIDPEKDMETAVEMVKSLLNKNGFSLETTTIRVIGV